MSRTGVNMSEHEWTQVEQEWAEEEYSWTQVNTNEIGWYSLLWNFLTFNNLKYFQSVQF